MKFVNEPNVCYNQPVYGELFCQKHLESAKEEGIHSYDEGMESPASDPKWSSLFEEEMGDPPSTKPSGDQYNCLNKLAVAPWCRKDSGRRTQKGCWSRGYLVFVNGCGHISYFHPLYKSESLSQVYTIVIPWLYRRLRQLALPISEWN